MSYVAVFGDHQAKPRSGRRHALKFRMQFGTLSLSIITIALAAVLSILYFMQVNRLTMSGYTITKLETEMRTLKDDNKKLQYEISQRKALSVVDSEARNTLHMVPAEEVQYWWKDQANLLARNETE